jgi:hypothetical protein
MSFKSFDVDVPKVYNKLHSHWSIFMVCRKEIPRLE